MFTSATYNLLILYISFLKQQQNSVKYHFLKNKKLFLFKNRVYCNRKCTNFVHKFFKTTTKLLLR